MKKTGAGGEPQNYDKATGRYASDGKSGESPYRQNKSPYSEILKADKAKRGGYNNGTSPPKKRQIVLSAEEYNALRKEVMRKNAEQKGRVRLTNYAFTANCFYVYSTTGDDDFKVLERYDIEFDRESINKRLTRMVRLYERK